MILIIDNYDSFVFNIARYVRELNFACQVIRNDAITVADIRDHFKPSHIIISPGPCTPREAGISVELVQMLGAATPILGICLGHQAIGTAYGGTIVRAEKPMHGMAAPVKHQGHPLFKGLSNPFIAGRYHSLVVDKIDLPNELAVIAESLDGEIMALAHKHYPVLGVQFHPESILTEDGYTLLNHFLHFKSPHAKPNC